MPRQKAPSHMYGVYLTAYASDEIKQRVEAGTMHISDPEQLKTHSFYYGTSRAQAERAFSRASIVAYTTELAFMVTLDQDGVVLARMRVER
jgi:hypothetical protein